jgi:hypothetical protein
MSHGTAAAETVPYDFVQPMGGATLSCSKFDEAIAKCTG